MDLFTPLETVAESLPRKWSQNARPIEVRSQGHAIGANDELVLPLTITEQSCVRLSWKVAPQELDFTATFTPDFGEARTLLTVRSDHMHYSDGALLELEGAGMLNLQWGHWPGVYAYLTGETADAVLSYDIRLLTASAQAEVLDEEQTAARRAQINQLWVNEQEQRAEEHALREEAVGLATREG